MAKRGHTQGTSTAAPLSSSPSGTSGASSSLATDDLAPSVGANIRQLRQQQRLSLDRLATMSGVSRAMLSQIELGRSAPTINVLWKIAKALDVPFSTLLSEEERSHARVMRLANARRLTSQDGRFSTRALFPVDAPRRIEFYELRLLPGAVEQAEAHPRGTTENLVVAQGRLRVDVEGTTHDLDSGDAIFFLADLPHTYTNLGPETAILYLVMTYAETS